MKAILTCIAVFAAAGSATAQIPDKFENLEVLPTDISRQELTQTMRSFAIGLGVRCVYCHIEKKGAPAGPDGTIPLDYASDEKTEKKKARVMMKMTRTINTTLLADLPERTSPAVNVQCVTCHRGSRVPKLLGRVLAEVIEKQGIDSAVVRYRQLREQTITQGLYNFSELTINDLAQELVAASKTTEAIRMLELNQEFYPQSVQIDFQLGEIHRVRGEAEKARARYKRVLEKAPGHQQAQRRLQELQ